jgi:hypothetical protein
MDGTAIGRYLLATLRHAIVGNDGSDQQTIVAKDAFAANRLRRSMRCLAAPANYRLFVTPERKGEEFVGIGKTLEPLDGDEAIHAFKLAF